MRTHSSICFICAIISTVALYKLLSVSMHSVFINFSLHIIQCKTYFAEIGNYFGHNIIILKREKRALMKIMKQYPLKPQMRTNIRLHYIISVN